MKSNKSKQRKRTIFFLIAGTVFLTVLYKILNPTRPSENAVAPRPQVLQPAQPVKVPVQQLENDESQLDEVADDPDLDVEDSARNPAAVAAVKIKRKGKKADSYELQQERKRFLSACQNFEKYPTGSWKKIVKKFPELQKSKTSKSALKLPQSWKSLSTIVLAETKDRAIASSQKKATEKIRSLREKFLRRRS